LQRRVLRSFEVRLAHLRDGKSNRRAQQHGASEEKRREQRKT
jgi:hypothetical protein